MPSFDEIKRGYRNLWNDATLDPERVTEIDSVVVLILEEKQRYKAAARPLGIPWYFIPPIHYRESSLRFNGAFHNGDQIIGTGQKTTNHPPGRGPFATWEESVVDAIQMKGLHNIVDWPLERLLFEWENYNGWGYWGIEDSPYVWAGTSRSDETGKYIRDGVYDPNAEEKQLGTAALLKGLIEHDEEVARAIAGIPEPEPVGNLGAFSNEELLHELLVRGSITAHTNITFNPN